MLGPTWNAVEMALTKGHRGLPKGWTLAKLLHEYRGIRPPGLIPRYTVKQILVWADDYKKRTGLWPTYRSGPVRGVPGETWMAVHRKLQDCGRGLRGGSSMIRLFQSHRGIRNRTDAPLLTHKKILALVDNLQASPSFARGKPTGPRHRNGARAERKAEIGTRATGLGAAPAFCRRRHPSNLLLSSNRDLAKQSDN